MEFALISCRLSRTVEMNEVRLGLVTSLLLLLRHRYLQWPWPLSPSVLTRPLPLQLFRCIRACVGGERQRVLDTLLLILPVSFLSAVTHRDEKAETLFVETSCLNEIFHTQTVDSNLLKY